jgi:hypothetical protein
VSPNRDNTGRLTGQVSGISEFTLVNDQIEILATVDQTVSASAQAFMQGLYPPSSEVYGNPSEVDESRIVNRTLMDFPLGGYQYPNILAVGPQDPSFVYLAGHSFCPNYAETAYQYIQSEEGMRVWAESEPFYADLHTRVLHDIFARETINYFNAQHIFDYLRYEYLHNATIRNVLSLDDLNRARYLADQLLFAQNANTSAVGQDTQSLPLNPVAGMTLADYVVQAFEANIQQRGMRRKLSLVFGGFEPLMALSALLGLPSDRQPNFYGQPNFGASMVIEFFSLVSNISAEYPQTDSEFMVRFLLRNGTEPWDLSTPLVPYPMFGLSPSQSTVPYPEFLGRLINVSMHVTTWCRVCGSPNTFCLPYTSVPRGDCPPPSGTGLEHLGIAGLALAIVCLSLIITISFIKCYPNRMNPRILCAGIKKLQRRHAPLSQPAIHVVSPPGSSSSGEPESFEMARKCSTRSSSSTTEQSMSTPNCDDDDGDTISLVSPAAHPVRVRAMV